MRAVMLDDRRKQDWEEYVLQDRNSVAWQSYEWSGLVRKHYKTEFFPIAAVDDKDNIQGILPIYRIKTRRSGNVLVSVPHAVAGGMSCGSEDGQRLLFRQAVDISNQCGRCRVIFKQYKIRFAGDTAVDDNFYNRELNLSQGIDRIWIQLSEVNKEQIDRAKHFDCALDFPSTDVDVFYRLLLDFSTRRGTPCVSKEWIRDLIGFKLYSIALLRLNGRVVSGTLVKEFKDTVSFPFSCVSEEKRTGDLFAYNLYWKLIECFVVSGKRIFHSGRIPKTEETNKYRLGWGGNQYSYYYQYYPNTVQKMEFGEKRGRKRQIVERIWKRLPPPIAKYLGPYIVKQFP